MTVISVRPFREQNEFERMVDYFLTADDALLFAMRIDRAKLPDRQAWLERILADQKNPDEKKARFYLAWLYSDRHVGHCSINDIKIGEDAIIHLHLYEPGLRKSGIGTEFFKRSLVFYFERFNFKKIICEPFCDNPAPNKLLIKQGFEFVKRYKTIPTPISFEQEVNRYELRA
jgi:[ribosomal protein S5]-alanine N-acetyltransferase